MDAVFVRSVKHRCKERQNRGSMRTMARYLAATDHAVNTSRRSAGRPPKAPVVES
ncbi:hypothetical protein HRUBRA_01978 [Pseudohaliea rubra DSM 19751]|uniref:Uncharacterized protein n=1 Tax=Pseudohaliea rubra DSM 19751 TaxID=1265313 RepID=A0A095WYB6_9GAMM|nr:hypothetical protein HRUBRA_01978 [Pseudohaliea rubra DSM 19751]